MRPLLVDEIRVAIRGRWRSAAAPATVTAVATDSRTAARGELFIALRGPNFDGHDFLARAAAAGCPAAVVNADSAAPDNAAAMFPGGLIAVADTTTALADLAAWHRSRSGATVIAVTGSNGKTTVKRMIHAMLSAQLSGSCSPKSFNNRIGLPLTLLAAAPGDDYVVCEIGTSGPGEIAALARIAQPDVAVITSIGPAHLGGLDSIERIAAEKASILSFLAGDGLGVVWADSDQLNLALRAHASCRIVRFGVCDSAELRLTGYECRDRGQRFQLNGRLWVDMPLCGRHNALNALAALAVAQRLGLDEPSAVAALGELDMPGMRMQWIDAGRVTIINDGYNANPASVAAAADVLAETPAKRTVMILGDMLELGPADRELHIEAGRLIAARAIDFLIGIGPLGRYIAMGAAESGMAVETFDCVGAAGVGISRLLRAGDVILLKASRAVGIEALVGPIRAAFAGRRKKKR